jgi:hypothetical protein
MSSLTSDRGGDGDANERELRERICLKIIIDDAQLLSVRHNPPLPDMDTSTSASSSTDGSMNLSIAGHDYDNPTSEASNDNDDYDMDQRVSMPSLDPTLQGNGAVTSLQSTASSTSSLYRIDPQHLSLPRLLSHILTAHANERIRRLHAWLLSLPQQLLTRACSSLRLLHSYGNVNTNTSSGSSSDDGGVSSRCVLHVLLVGDRCVQIKTDTQSGRFVLEWTSLSSSSPSNDAPISIDSDDNDNDDMSDISRANASLSSLVASLRRQIAARTRPKSASPTSIGVNNNTGSTDNNRLYIRGDVGISADSQRALREGQMLINQHRASCDQLLSVLTTLRYHAIIDHLSHTLISLPPLPLPSVPSTPTLVSSPASPIMWRCGDVKPLRNAPLIWPNGIE